MSALNDLFAKLVKLPISYTDTHAHGDLMSRMTNDVDNISNTVSSTLGSLVSGVLTIIGCLAIMIWYSPLLTLVSMVSLILTLLVTAFMSKFMRPLFQKQQSLLGNLNTQTEEMVTGIKTVAAYNHQEIAKDEFNHFSDTYCRVVPIPLIAKIAPKKQTKKYPKLPIKFITGPIEPDIIWAFKPTLQ